MSLAIPDSVFFEARQFFQSNILLDKAPGSGHDMIRGAE